LVMPEVANLSNVGSSPALAFFVFILKW